MNKNEEFEEIVKRKYKEMKEKNISVDFIFLEKFGGLTVYINQPPLISIFSITIESDQVDVGGRF